MIQALYSGASAIKSQQRNIDVISNNVSNINTVSFKKSRTDFKDAIYQRMLSPTDNSPEMNLQRGHGSLVYQTRRIFFQGAITPTSSPLDLAIEGEGFFTLQTPEGENVYTRNGNFYASVEEEANYLVNSDGYYVLDENGDRIVLEGNLEQMSIGLDGSISLAGADVPGQKITLVTFTNSSGLAATGRNNFTPSENSGDAAASDNGVMVQRAVEASNVDLADEMTRLVRAQRAYQLASRTITTADRMAETANGIR